MCPTSSRTPPTETEDPEFVSKSQLKREAQEVTDLAQLLVDAKPGLLSKVPIPEEIEADLKLARKISSHIARKRQILFLAKKMRELDLEPIRKALTPDDAAHRQSVARMHAHEHWRDRIVAEGDSAIEDLMVDYPQADRQRLRQLARQANKEIAKGKPPVSGRAIYKLIGELEPEAENGS